MCGNCGGNYGGCSCVDCCSCCDCNSGCDNCCCGCSCDRGGGGDECACILLAIFAPLGLILLGLAAFGVIVIMPMIFMWLYTQVCRCVTARVITRVNCKPQRAM